jgi:hypothetical protein
MHAAMNAAPKAAIRGMMLLSDSRGDRKIKGV